MESGTWAIISVEASYLHKSVGILIIKQLSVPLGTCKEATSYAPIYYLWLTCGAGSQKPETEIWVAVPSRRSPSLA